MHLVGLAASSSKLTEQQSAPILQALNAVLCHFLARDEMKTTRFTAPTMSIAAPTIVAARSSAPTGYEEGLAVSDLQNCCSLP